VRVWLSFIFKKKTKGFCILQMYQYNRRHFVCPEKGFIFENLFLDAAGPGKMPAMPFRGCALAFGFKNTYLSSILKRGVV
jgi:hypothetical protein